MQAPLKLWRIQGIKLFNLPAHVVERYRYSANDEDCEVVDLTKSSERDECQVTDLQSSSESSPNIIPFKPIR